MKNMKKNLALLLALLMVFSVVLAGCGGGADDADPGRDDTGSDRPEDYVPTIGIVQVIEHTSLNMIRDSLIGQLAEDGYVDGETIHIDIQNGQGDPSIIKTICQQFTAKDYDVIIAIATITAQVAMGETTEIPIVFSAVTDPVHSQIVASLDLPGGNVTGTSDYVSVENIMELASELTPGFTTIGALYCTSEDNSFSVVADLKAYAEANGLEVIESPVTNSNEIAQAARNLVGKVDIVFSPIDNVIASAMPMSTQIFDEANLPFYVSADSMVMDGGLATYGVDYVALGSETAQMVKDILEGADPAAMPVRIMTDIQVYINTDTAERIGVEIPDSLKERATLFTDANAGNAGGEDTEDNAQDDDAEDAPVVS